MKSVSSLMRTWHRDLGYFTIGLTLLYAITGIILSGRSLGWLVQDYKDRAVLEKHITEKEFPTKFKQAVLKGKFPEIFEEDIYEAVEKRMKVRLTKQKKHQYVYRAFKSVKVQYSAKTGNTMVSYRGYPMIIEEMVIAHKANHKRAWFYLAIFYSIVLAFFAISSFWMMKGKNKKRGLILASLGALVMVAFLIWGL